jgi:hypothetical protein
MRDNRFIAEHLGGPLKKEEHRQLIKWACDCAEHVLPLCGERPDARLADSILVAEEWRKGNASVGDARKASLRAITAANDSSDQISLYALKAVKIAGKSVDAEKKWQKEKLPEEILDLVLSAYNGKEKYFIH